MSNPQPPKTDDQPAEASPADEATKSDADDGIIYGDQSVHLAFQRQISEMLDKADISEEEKQQFLIAMNCPCCGAGGMSFSFKIKSGPDTPSF